jgi:hypothetical protein
MRYFLPNEDDSTGVSRKSKRKRPGWLLSAVVSVALCISLFLAGCSDRPYQNLKAADKHLNCLADFKPTVSRALFYTQINVVGKHLSGLLLFKKMPDSSIRTVFTTESGVKFFDFEYAGSQFKVLYCIKQLNKKAVINQLRKDIGLTIMAGVDIPSAKLLSSESERYFGFSSRKEYKYYITDPACSKLKRIETTSRRKKKLIVHLSDYKNGMADSIYIEHQLFRFNISLKQLEK